jgi:hypothetical protein
MAARGSLMGYNKDKIGLKDRIRSFFTGDFYGNSIVRWLLAAGVLLNLANWSLLAFFIRRVDFPIILHYNVYFGVDIIGDWRQVYLTPLMGLVFWLVNLALARHFYAARERIASYILLLGALLVQLGLAVASIAVVVINY